VSSKQNYKKFQLVQLMAIELSNALLALDTLAERSNCYHPVSKQSSRPIISSAKGDVSAQFEYFMSRLHHTQRRAHNRETTLPSVGERNKKSFIQHSAAAREVARVLTGK
jgi:hypothetical protein